MRAAWRVVLVFDGGSRGNPGPAYGSYWLQLKPPADAAVPPLPPVSRTLDLGLGTNNEAEYQTLILGLQAALDRLAEAGVDPSQAHLEVRGDSQLVLRQVERAWKAKDPRMRRLRDEAQALLRHFGSAKLVSQPRARTVATLGH